MGPMTGTRLAHGDGSVLLLPPVLVLVDVAALARGGGLLLGFLRGRGRLRDRGRCGSGRGGRGRGGRGGRGRVGTASEQLAQLLQVRLDAVALAVELLVLLLGGREDAVGLTLGLGEMVVGLGLGLRLDLGGVLLGAVDQLLGVVLGVAAGLLGLLAGLGGPLLGACGPLLRLVDHLLGGCLGGGKAFGVLTLGLGTAVGQL